MFLKGWRFILLPFFTAIIISCCIGCGGNSYNASDTAKVSISLRGLFLRARAGYRFSDSGASALPEEIDRVTVACSDAQGTILKTGELPLDGTPLILEISAGPNRIFTVEAYAGDILRMSGTSTVSYLSPNTQITVTITLQDLATLNLIPATITTQTSSTQQFTANVTHHLDTSVQWSVNDIIGGNDTIGTIDPNGLYTAPASVPEPPTLTIRATSNEDPTLYQEAIVTITASGITISISPSSGSILTNESRQFTAQVTGTINTNVSWFVNNIEGGNYIVGTIDPNGLYKAPDAIPSPPQVTITATSLFDPNASNTASVTIVMLGFFEATYWGNESNQTGQGISVYDSNLYVAGYGHLPTATYEAILLQFDIPPGDTGPVWETTWGTYEVFFDLAVSDANSIYCAGFSNNLSQHIDIGGKEAKSMITKYVPPNTDPVWYDCPVIQAYSGYESFRDVLVKDGFIYVTGYAQYAWASGQYPGCYRQAFLWKDEDEVNTPVWTSFFTNAGLYDCRGQGLVWSKGYIYVTGYDGEGSSKAVLAQYDEEGNLNPVWGSNITYQPPGRIAFSYGVAADSSGNIYQVGYSDVDPSIRGDEDILFLKYDEDGNRLWDKEWGGPEEDKGWAVACTDTQLFIIGNTKSYGSGGNDVVLLQVDPANGTVLSEIFWGGPGGEACYDMVLTDTDIYMTGATSSVGAGGSDILLLRYDLTGSASMPAISVSVEPLSTSLGLSEMQAFTAIVHNTTNGNVAWYVDNIRGGDPNVGTIDENGLYTAPSGVPSASSVTVMAVSFVNPSVNGTATINFDSDLDGLTDNEESILGTDPLDPDSDDDYLTDGEEVNLYNTEPLIPDTDEDGFNDGEEIIAGTDPLDKNSFPSI